MNNDARTENAVPATVEMPADVELSQGGVIRYLRRQLGMTQEDLAHALGITVGTVSRWEKGRFRPSRLARALILEFAREHNVPLNLKPMPRHG